ncbi:MAG: hypothetical protein GY794_01400 [bacterium]|nr:hypothetical protein [bacterium]
MAKYLTPLLVVMLFCGLLVFQCFAADTSKATAAKASPAQPTTKPAPKPKVKAKAKSQSPTPAEKKELLQFLKKHRAEFYNSLMTQKKTDKRRYAGTLRFAWQWYTRYKQLNDAVRSEIDREQKTRIWIRKALGKIKGAKTRDEYKKLLAELSRLVGMQFDVQTKISRYKLDQAYNQLSRLRKELSNRQRERKKIVDQRVADWVKKAGVKPPEDKTPEKKK